ncbi:MAG: SRPBCC domain-containing protein [Pseudomonadota bacterium]
MTMPVKTTETPSQTHEVTISRDIAASPERVFEIWTDPQAMMHWFGKDGMTSIDMAFEAEEGGHWHARARNADGETFRILGRILAIEPARRLLQSWTYEAPDGTLGNETEVEILFEPSAKGCRVRVCHRKILYTPDAFRDGWEQSVGRIAAMLTS